MPNFKLHKSEKLCGRTAIDKLFASGTSVTAYPLRAVFRTTNRACGAPAQFLVSVPKKKIKKAVGRVLLRRRIREAYRLNRDLIKATLSETETKIDIAFIYLSDKPAEYETISNKMRTLLSGISDRIAAIEAERGNE